MVLKEKLKPKIFFALLTLSVLLIAFSKIPNKRHSFVRVDESMGINFIKATGGVSWADYNDDGWEDLVITTENGIRLFENDKNGKFIDVTEKAGFQDICCGSKTAVFGDYDNDGSLDLYLVNSGSDRTFDAKGTEDILFENNGNGTFTDVTNKAGVTCNGHGEGAAWADYDHDGYLDIFVANYGVHDIPKSIHHHEDSCLLRNNGDGTFTDVGKKLAVAGISSVNKKEYQDEKIKRRSLPYQPIFFDYDNDGWEDLFVATDIAASPLYKNNGDGTFTDVTEEAGLNKFGTGMGVSAGDYDNDGDFDLYVTNDGPNYLWRNNDDGTFDEVAEEVGVAHDSVGWGTFFLDYDNDGDLDLFVTNGAVYEDLTEIETLPEAIVNELPKKNIDSLYENKGDGTFVEITKEAGIDIKDFAVKRGTASGDFNQDGFPDIVIAPYILQIEKKDSFMHPRLYRNEGNKNRWLTIQLVGIKSNRDGIGARVKVTAGGKSQIQEVASGGSFLSQNSLWLTFGIGTSSMADKVEVEWPSGIKQTLSGIKANQKIVITEPDSF